MAWYKCNCLLEFYCKNGNLFLVTENIKSKAWVYASASKLQRSHLPSKVTGRIKAEDKKWDSIRFALLCLWLSRRSDNFIVFNTGRMTVCCNVCLNDSCSTFTSTNVHKISLICSTAMLHIAAKGNPALLFADFATLLLFLETAS